MAVLELRPRRGTPGRGRDGAVAVERRADDLVAASFTAMASPCEVLLSATSVEDARDIGECVAQEAWRIEKKFSRYRDDSVLARIHRNRGVPITLDEESAALIAFARQSFEISDGLFDITSGVLRAAWRFDGSDGVPAADTVERLLPRVGFEKLTWQPPQLTVPDGMELDLGGIGKEYAVDRAFHRVAASRSAPFLINFGGDLRASGPPPGGAWQIGVERPDADRDAALILELERGALATSGDSHRFLLKDGTRYGHILDPRTGWPVPEAPRSVTVAASSCTEAGLLATLASLQGTRAEAFLLEQGLRYWILR
jgi:thiamine biosynthesis lipoprotein